MHIHVEVLGEGEPVVLVHGWGTDARRNWIDTGWADALAAVRRVVLLDVRGHGRSEKPTSPGAYGYRAMSEDVVQVMDELGLAAVDYVGYSMGSFMGVALLGSHPHRFRSMVLGGIGDETRESAAVGERVADALRASDASSITDPVGRAYRAYVERVPGNDREALAQAAAEMWPDGHPLELGGPALGDVDVPVLIVNGADDHPYVDTAPRLAAALRSAELRTIPGTDHVTALSHPDFVTATVAFLLGRTP